MKWSLGLMSGTSIDGIDIAAIQTDGINIFKVLPGFTQPYPEGMRQRLKSILGQKVSSPLIQEIEHEITLLHFHVVEQFLHFNQLSPRDIEVIGFHGHTIFHQSKRHEGIAHTWQIGDGQLLAEKTGITVVGQLRQNDVAHGGEGAPLVPLYHQALAHDLEKPLAVVNIGGVSNVTWLGRHNEMLAFDMGPGNALIDDWMLHHTGQPWDTQGKVAATGKIDKAVVEQFLMHPYFQLLPPKSLDRDTFKNNWVDHLSVADGAATLTAMTTAAMGQGATFSPEMPLKWVITGGGRHNSTLMKMLRATLNTDQQKVEVVPVEEVHWNGDHLEAEAFAFLAMRSLKGLPLTFPTTTGVSKPLSGGVVYRP